MITYILRGVVKCCTLTFTQRIENRLNQLGGAM